MSKPETEGDGTTTQNTSAVKEKDPEVPSGKVLSGSDELFDGVTHVGVAIEVAADGKVSHLLIPDATRIKEGGPIYITAPVRLKGENLAKYLQTKGVNLDNALGRLLTKTRVSCEAFYFSTEKEKLDTQDKLDAYNKANPPTAPAVAKVLNDEIERGPLLMMFEVAVDGGLIGTLADDPDLGKLFDINSVMLRVLRCPATKRSVLEKYVRDLPQE